MAKINTRGTEEPPKNAFAALAGGVERPKSGPSRSMKAGVDQPKTAIRQSPGRDMAGGRGNLGSWADSHHPVGRR